MREEMLSASLAGLAALAVNCGEADELVWNDTVVQRYGEWKARTVARLGLEDRGTFTPWELLERGMRAGWVRGYVAYARDPSGRKAYTAKNASTNESVNVATSLAGIHRAVLIEESLIPRAEALGLRMLADGHAAASTAPFTRWVSVHAWSSHELADGTKVTGVGAAAALADRLKARGIRVVRPDELLHRIRDERDGTPALHVVSPGAPFR